ncbi:ABC transporter ATP-binding protein [Desulfobacter curvatus]|uniref:ABC transporter ATP-binding protein n=1 Tax=Desulfobacter curvatus TaxID=2290 RepID=UPI0003688588|nr:ABC transporter ATP-binding protein [Desulfobacter curvatus]
MNTLLKLQTYMGGRKALLPGALVLSAISSLMGMLPFIFIWLIAGELFKSQADSSPELINIYAWYAMGTAVGGVCLYFLALTLSHLAAFRAETNMRRQAMQKIVKLPLGFFDTNTSGRIRKIIDDNASVTHTFLAHQMPDLAGSIMMPIASLVLIFVFDFWLGLACLFPIITALIIMSSMMGKRGRHFMKRYMDALEEMNTEAVEYVRGIPVVKVFQQTVFSFKNFYNSITRYKDMVSQFTMMWEKPMSAYTVIIHGFVYVLVPVAILLMGNSGNPADVLLDLIFFILITPVFAQSVMKNMYMNQAMGQATEAVKRIETLTDVDPLPAAPDPVSIKGHEISFTEVSFTYPGSRQKAIDNISFSIPEGKTYALVGASGSGKTTIARLVPRFWDADTGEVAIGGSNVKDISPKELMQHVSFVFQNTRLFKTTLLENIRYGNPHATDQAIEQAVDLAQCREIINKLPGGLNTKIGTNGTYLSGGEQQRIALARAILKDAPIVVLDEATAFSDPENEHLIQKALGKLTKGKTVLTIAHRLTSVVDVDSILVIDKGQIAEQGNHHELINRQGVYARMWNEYQRSIQWTIGKEVQYA